MSGDKAVVPVRAGYRINRIETATSSNTPSVTAAGGGLGAKITANPSDFSEQRTRRCGGGQNDQTQEERIANTGSSTGVRQQAVATSDNRNSDGTRRGGRKSKKSSRAGGRGGHIRGEHKSGDFEHSVKASIHVPTAGRRNAGDQPKNNGVAARTPAPDQQQTRPGICASPTRTPSCNIAVSGGDTRSQPDREQSTRRRGRGVATESNTGGNDWYAGGTFQRALSQPLESLNDSRRTDPRDRSGTDTISRTADKRRDIHSRLGSPPRSPRNSLLRDDSRPANKEHHRNRRQQHQRHPQHEQRQQHHHPPPPRPPHRQQQRHNQHLQHIAPYSQSDVRREMNPENSPRGKGTCGEPCQAQSSASATDSGRDDAHNAAHFSCSVEAQDTAASRPPSKSLRDLDGLGSCESGAPPSSIRHTQLPTTAARSRSGTDYAKGTCMTMCPKSEILERQEEGTLSIFEATDDTAHLHFRRREADPAKVVKKYRRSAAGRDMHSPELLRPLSVLQQTSTYLVKKVFAAACQGSDDGKRVESDSVGGVSSITRAYVFVEDRLRAVRQDLTVQGLGIASEAAEILKLVANFYIVAGYLLSDQPSDVFDKHLHIRELQGVFTSLSDMFFQARELSMQVSRPLVEKDEYMCLQAVHALAAAVSDNTNGEAPLAQAAGAKGVGSVFATAATKLCAFSRPPNRLYKSCTSNDSATSNTGGSGLASVSAPTGSTTPDTLRSAYPKMALSIRLLSAVGAGNWTEFHRLLGRTNADGAWSGCNEVLVGGEGAESSFAIRLRCLSYAMLLPIRAHALRALNKSFGKKESVPLVDVRKSLQMPTDEHTAGLCRALSLPVEAGGYVVFKAVPAVWKNDDARQAGFLAPPGESSKQSCMCSREDKWVGIESRWLTKGIAGSGEALGDNSGGTCQSCGGFGCRWCEVDAKEVISWGLWEAALAPT